MITKPKVSSIICLILLGAGQAAFAAVSLLNQNFESNAEGDKLVLPWTWSVETYADNSGAPGAYIGGYYPGDNASTAIHAVIAGQSGAQGNNALKVYGDYGYAPNHTDNKWLATNIYQGRTLLPTDVADGGLKFQFDFAAYGGAGGIEAKTIAAVYFQLLSPNYSTTYLRYETPVTSLDATFQSASLYIPLDNSNVGNQLQWGFMTRTQNYSASAILVDNISVTSIPEPTGTALAAIGAVLLGIRRRRI